MSETQRIRYYNRADGAFDVKLDEKTVGVIRLYSLGWQYKPRGGQPGDFYATLTECKESLEGDDDD